MTTSITLNCAVYARTSGEEAIDDEFSSIEAQRQAGLNYIASQRGLNWAPVASEYNDTNISGGTLARNALSRLLADIESGEINVVVVYKLDRISRSMKDFSELMEVFDQHQVVLVSVTQHLNSQDALGRFAIHTLMSFAQFEREIIGERIRDKIAVTRRKGLWIGSVPPLGYDVKNQHLIINESEAKIVQLIFKRLVELESMSELVLELDNEGITTKCWRTRTGKKRGGQLFPALCCCLV